MSDVAQKRDLYDPKTIVDFASIVKNQKNLDYLLALTVADIMSVGPSIWNAWKSGLLRTLYNETSNYLSGDKNKSIENENNCIKAQDKFKEKLSDWPKLLINSYVHRFSNNYWLTTSIEQQIEHAKILKDKDSKNIVRARGGHINGHDSGAEYWFAMYTNNKGEARLFYRPYFNRKVLSHPRMSS